MNENFNFFDCSLPEIGEDLPEKNPLLKEETLLPEFNGLTIERCIAAVAKQSIEFEQGIKVLEKELAGKKLSIPLKISNSLCW